MARADRLVPCAPARYSGPMIRALPTAAPGAALVFVSCLLLLGPARAGAQGFEVVEATIAQAHEAMRAGTLTCRGLLQAHLDRIEAYDQAGPRDRKSVV